MLPARTILYNMLTNVLLLGWMFGGVWVYLRLRYQRQANLFRQYIGSGDVWFLLLLTPLFALPVYVVLLLCGFGCGLLYGTFVRINRWFFISKGVVVMLAGRNDKAEVKTV